MTLRTIRKAAISVTCSCLFGASVSAEPFCSELLSTDQLLARYQRLAPIQSNTDTGWIFTADQMSETYELKSEATLLMAEIVGEFERRDIELAWGTQCVECIGGDCHWY